jgi:DNA/RNA-binding domain of Phe-tRNA-synthetase-like protein
METHPIFELTPEWKSAFPGAHAGVLILREVANPAHHPGLAEQKAALEERLRSQFSGQDRSALVGHPVLNAYNEYYRRFKKTYHVQLQLESVIWKGKAIPAVAALVEAMFMAEIKNMLLTAGHDLDILQLPLRLDVSKGTEKYTLMRGEEQLLKAGDMMISDGLGIISNIIYGPDRRTQITADTRNVIFTVYAPSGIDQRAVIDHLQDIHNYALLIAPQAHVELLEVFGSD